MRLWGSIFRGGAKSAYPVLASEYKNLMASLLSLAWVIEARDPYTGGHLWRVSRYCALLCERAGLEPETRAQASVGGFLHDLGKIAIPDGIIRKAGPLSPDEVAIVRTHPSTGARLVAAHPLAKVVQDVIYCHHETPDGQGYPNGLKAEQIPIAARVVGICDAFDAMTSSRPYRKPTTVEQALGNLELGLATQFDETLGRLFIELGSVGVLEHIAGHCDDGIPLQSCTTCGPTLVVRREQRRGDYVYCRNCGGEYMLYDGGPAAPLVLRPTGAIGKAADLEPCADTAQIDRFIADNAHSAALAML